MTPLMIDIGIVTLLTGDDIHNLGQIKMHGRLKRLHGSRKRNKILAPKLIQNLQISID